MERRNIQRKKLCVEAEITADDFSCTGIVENLSVRGMSVETDSHDLLSQSTRFTPGTKFQVKFETPGGEVIILNCKVIWSFKIAPHGLRRKVGMEVVFPPPNYIEYCQTP
jgi:hypothetical protein